MSFTLALSEEERLVQETARRFAEDRLLPRVRAHERNRGVAPELVREFTALGLVGADVGAFVRAIVLEELAAVDPGAAVALDGVGPAIPFLNRAPEGPGFRAVVVDDVEEHFRLRDGRLDGEHPWVPADRIDVAVILHGDRAYVVREGWRLDAVKPCGLEAAGASRLALANAPVAAVVEAARGTHRYAMRYAMERTAFGRPIAHHQALAFLIADLATAVDAARLAVWRAAAALDRGETAEWEAACALAEAAEQALLVGPNAVQILGGHGFMKDHPVEKWMRDIRTLAGLAGGRDAVEVAVAALAPEHEAGLR